MLREDGAAEAAEQLAGHQAKERQPLAERIPAVASIGTAAVIAVATLWLGVTGQLTLYINPATVWFAMTMSVVVLFIVLASLVVRGEHAHHHHEAIVASAKAAPGSALQSRHGEAEPGTPYRARHAARVSLHAERSLNAAEGHAAHEHSNESRHLIARSVWAVGIFAIATAAVLIVPPTTLSARAAQQRATTSLTSQLTGSQQRVLMGSDTAKFTVADWANLIESGASTDFVVGKQASMIGFVGSSKRDPHAFDLTRFVITCCALDAQPVSVSVTSANLTSNSGAKLKAGQWVHVSGTFVTRAAAAGNAPTTVFHAQAITLIKKPTRPYVF